MDPLGFRMRNFHGMKQIVTGSQHCGLFIQVNVEDY